ncbi:MAG: TonB-dependent receptor [Pseudomonadales bacterium]
MKTTPLFQVCSLASIALATGTAPAVAQSDSLVLEEVVVTAQKREQSLQDVPISVVAFGTDQLAVRGIDDLTDISASIPSLVVNSLNNDPGAVRLFIRGIGQNDVQLTQDPSVALYLDGVYIGSSFGSGFEGVDIERLEVLRGPQGTLYGRNATGGAVNIITQRANVDALGARQDVTGGNLGTFKSRTMINVPLSDNVAAKLNYLVSERRDGVVENSGVGADFGEEDRTSLVADLRWHVTDDIVLDYRYEQAEMEDSQRFEQVTAVNTGAPLAGVTTITQASPDRLDNVSALRAIDKNDLEISAHTLQGEWPLNDAMTLKSITAYREFDNNSTSDPLSTSELISGGAISLGNFRTEFEQFSQEFQLIGDTEHLQYVAGLYYYQDEGDSRGVDNILLGNPRDLDTTTTENTSLALFGEATYTPAFMDQRWHITLGARYSEDNRKAQRSNLNLDMPIVDGQYDENFSNFNPALTVSFDVNESVNVYGKVVSGFKSGGTSQRSADATLFALGFEEEEILSYEAGLKGGFWDQRVRLNMAVYSMDIDGSQTSAQTGATPGERDFFPIDDNSIDGVEMDVTVLLNEGLTLNVGAGYMDTELGADSVVSVSGVVEELTDEFAFAPQYSYTAGLDYARSLANGELTASINYNYQDDVVSSVGAAGSVIHDGYGLLGASLSWADIKLGDIDGTFKLLLWGKNLADEEYTTAGGGAWRVFGAQQVLTFGDPRTYGLTVSYFYD